MKKIETDGKVRRSRVGGKEVCRFQGIVEGFSKNDGGLAIEKHAATILEDEHWLRITRTVGYVSNPEFRTRLEFLCRYRLRQADANGVFWCRLRFVRGRPRNQNQRQARSKKDCAELSSGSHWKLRWVIFRFRPEGCCKTILPSLESQRYLPPKVAV